MNVRYYVLYLMTIPVSVAAGMLIANGDRAIVVTVEGVVAILWFLLAIITEETMRAVDDFYKV